MEQRELAIQESIISYLENKEIYPFSVICTFSISNGLVSISFYTKQDLYSFLDLINYNNICDKTGYLVLEDNNTILLSNSALVNFYVNLL